MELRVGKKVWLPLLTLVTPDRSTDWEEKLGVVHSETFILGRI